MHHFHYVSNQLYCEDLPLRRIAEEVGTPVYVYSHATLLHHYKVFDGAFSQIPHITCFSVKANSNIAILRLFGSLGGGVDIVSGGELFRSLRAGISPEKIVYSGVGKTLQEIEYALQQDILMFNIESTQELEAISACAVRMNRRAGIALRVNPDVDPNTHPYISTGMKNHKFGIAIDAAVEAYERARDLKNIDVVGVDCHIGSQLTDVAPFVDALKRLRVLIELLNRRGISIKYLDLGGGLGIVYNREAPPQPSEYARAIMQELNDLPCTLIFEPGRVIVGNAGVLLTKVLYTKKTEKKIFVITDAGMNDLVRPSLYGSYHHIQPLEEKAEGEVQLVDVVGPICESSDFLARERGLPPLHSGDCLAVMSAGAYGFSMSSNYNSRPRAAEVLVVGDRHHVIRSRESLEDLTRKEAVPDFLKSLD
jgi:diaminopimelate decarboxylase